MQTLREINDNTRLLSTEELMIYTGLGRNRAMEFSRKIGATKNLGFRRVLHDRYVIDQVIEKATIQ